MINLKEIPARAVWSCDIGPISDEQWASTLWATPLSSLSPAQNLTQIFILHRAHYTPEKLFEWKCRDTAQCPRCKGNPANLIHMLWRCPKLHRYWHEVISMINSAFGTRMSPELEGCLLGIPDEWDILGESRILFQARKLIAQQWTSSSPPTIAEWKIQIRETLVKEKYIFLHRGCPGNFEKIWRRGMDILDI